MKFSPILLLVAFIVVETFADEHHELWQSYKVIKLYYLSLFY